MESNRTAASSLMLIPASDVRKGQLRNMSSGVHTSRVKIFYARCSANGPPREQHIRMGLWVYHGSFSGKILLKTVEVVKDKDVFWQINLEERLQMDQLSEQGGVLDRLFPPMVVSSTEEQLALGDRSQ